MKRLSFAFALLAAGLSLSPVAASAQQTGATRATQPSSAAAERDLRSFVDWVSEKMDKAEAGARREWPGMMADFDRQSKRLDKAADSLSVQSRREYSAQKARYQVWSEEQQRLEAQAKQPETAQQAQNRLLNEQVTISRAPAADLPELYEHLLANTREQRRQWTLQDWALASDVLTRLNTRYEKVRQQLTLEQRLRVRSLQGEFRTLEAARAGKEVYVR